MVHGWCLWCVAINNKGDILFLGGNNGAINISFAGTGRLLLSMKIENKSSGVLFISYNEKKKFICAVYANGKMRLWESNRGEILKSFDAHHDEVRSVAINRNATMVYLGGADYKTKVRDVNSGEFLRELEDHN